MSLLNSSNVHIIAEDILGNSNLPTNAAEIIVKDAEYKLREIIEIAQKFQRRSYKDKLSSKDILKAMKVLRLDAQYGYPTDVAARYRQINDEIWIIDEVPIQLTELMTNQQVIETNEPELNSHWLAIDGKRPNIPENHVTGIEDTQAMEMSESAGEVHDLSREQTEYYELFLNALSEGRGLEDMINSLETDSSLIQLLPYLCKSIFQIANEKNEIQTLERAVKMI